MSEKQFINDLSATYADIRRLDVKKINLKGKNILEYIKENSTIILDERGTKADDELDVWNSYVTKDENGNVIINKNAKPKEHSVKLNVETNKFVYEGITESQVNTLKTAVKVIDNEVLGTNDENIMYWQSNGLTDGKEMFIICTNLTSFSSDLSSLADGEAMFCECTNLTSFTSDLSSLTNGNMMFLGCENLTSFTSDLSSLISASFMFDSCPLTAFNSDLLSLTDGSSMFSNTNLTSFSSDLPRLIDGNWMFSYTNLTSFSSDLRNLTNGEQMFFYCGSLTSFSSNLPNLTNGSCMFDGCSLDTQSVANIIHFIPQRDARPTTSLGNGNITIGIGIANTDGAKQAFAEECYCDSWEELDKEFDDKNWVVQWQFNGPATFDLRGETPSTTIFAKLEEVAMPTDEKAHKPYYRYTSADSSKFYNIRWYHESNVEDESFTLFDSLEAAIEAFGVVPVNQH